MQLRNLIPLLLCSCASIPILSCAEAQSPAGQPGLGGPGGGFGGGFGPNRQTVQVLEKFDENKDGWLNTHEREPARKFAQEQKSQMGGRGFGPPGFGPPRFGPPGFGPPGFGPPGNPPENSPSGARPEDRPRDQPPAGGENRGGRGRGGPRGPNLPPAQPGKQVAKSDVIPLEGDLYDPKILRTIFLDFENSDWESELADFRDTDVDVPATMTVDGKEYANVGIRFRGNTSYQMVPSGYKRPLNVAMDLVQEDQRLYGYKTLNLLNGVNDPTQLSAALYSQIASQHMPAPKVNLVRLVVNGENWGIYSNVQQLNKDFLKDHYESSKGARWKVPGSPQSRGGLQYFGDDQAAYEKVFEAKDASQKSWKRLIEFCKLLNETPSDKLAETISPLVDMDELLWFLAIDIATVNSDGYWTRGSDYYIWLDEKNKFHFYPYDMNEAFLAGHGPGGGRVPGGGRGGPGAGRGPEGPGEFGPPPPDGRPQGDRPDQPGRGFGGPPGFMGGPAGGGGPDLDPLAGLDNDRFPLRSKILSVPEFQKQYLANIRTLGEKTMTWENIGPVVSQYRKLIESELKDDTRKLNNYEAFLKSTSTEGSPPPSAGTNPSAIGTSETLQQFFDVRSARLKKAAAQ